MYCSCLGIVMKMLYGILIKLHFCSVFHSLNITLYNGNPHTTCPGSETYSRVLCIQKSHDAVGCRLLVRSPTIFETTDYFTPRSVMSSICFMFKLFDVMTFSIAVWPLRGDFFYWKYININIIKVGYYCTSLAWLLPLAKAGNLLTVTAKSLKQSSWKHRTSSSS